MSSLILDKGFVDSYKEKSPNWGFNGLGYIVYKRTYSRIKENGENEEWHETIERCINGAQKIGAGYTKEEAERLFDLIFNLKCNFGGRMLWQLGTSTVDRFGLASLLNCWFISMRDIEDFCFVFEHLMLGGGVGFSVKREDIHQLPLVKKDVNIINYEAKDADFIVPDSRQGWVQLLRKLLQAFYVDGKSFSYSTILIRGAGEPIRGFGGTASGPKILIEGIEKISNIFRNREGKRLRSIDVLDINNIIGSIVVAGNVRRSAEVAIGDPDDYLYLRAKNWSNGNIPNWRSMSNNSIYADSYSHISDEIWNNGYILDKKTGLAKGEPYGFMNLPLSQKYGRLNEERKDNCEGGNPCQPSWATVLTKNGISTFENVNVGDEIWSETGWTKIIKKWSTGVKKVLEYKTTAGIFYGTENHRLVSNGVKNEAKNCDSIDILKGEYRTDIILNPQDIIDGLVFGDGGVHKASNNLVVLYIGENDKDYFNSEISEYIVKHRPGITEEAYEIVSSIKHDELPHTYLREIPSRFLYGSREKATGFLRGLYTANGSICGDRVTLKSASFKVISQTQLLLSSLGIRSYYTTNKPSTIKFSNGTYTSKESYDLNITGDKDKFFKIIGFIQKYKQEKLFNLINKQKSTNKGKQTFDIISVNEISEEEVFDITVDNNTHTYWTGGLNVSNCMEITLADGEACNLCEIYLNNIDSKEELIECATLLYKTQKCIWTLPALYEKTNKIVKKNMRIGLGVTGVCQSFEKLDWLNDCYLSLREYDKKWSEIRGWPESIKLTTLKPSGTLSLLAGSTPGVHPAYSKYYIRRVRMSNDDKLVKFCRDLGYHTEHVINYDKSLDHSTAIVEFPCFSGEKALQAKDMSAIDQLELVKKMQTLWADNSVSVTVYYRPQELEQIKEWLKYNYETSTKTVSFLLHNEHGFIQAPYEEISEQEYKEKIKKIKKISINSDIGSDSLDGIECAGGACPIK
jgi:ribonucleotide reductase alpha subunit